MKFDHPLLPAKILKRYKRFLADMEMPDGRILTVHTPNTGPMTTCWDVHWPALLSTSPNPERKYPQTLEMLHNGRTWIGVNTQLPNLLVEEALAEDKIPELRGYLHRQREKKIGAGRLDFYLQGKSEERGEERSEEGRENENECYIEVKNVTLLGEGGLAFFPDTVSERGTKHLEMLLQLKRQGARAVMLYIVQREDVEIFSPAYHLDPVYAKTLEKCHEGGVEILIYRCSLSPEGIVIDRKLPLCWTEIKPIRAFKAAGKETPARPQTIS